MESIFILKLHFFVNIFIAAFFVQHYMNLHSCIVVTAQKVCGNLPACGGEITLYHPLYELIRIVYYYNLFTYKYHNLINSQPDTEQAAAALFSMSAEICSYFIRHFRFRI